MSPAKKKPVKKNFFQDLLARINGNVIARNVILAVCGIIVFFVLASIFLNWFTRHGRYETVPDFSGMTIEEAAKAGRRGSLRIEVNDSLYVPVYEGGVILDQNPVPGAQVKSGRRIFVTTNSFRQKMVQIPYVTDYSLRQAKNNLEVAGLEIDKLVYRGDIATNYVLEQHFNNQLITSGSKVEGEVGSGVTLVVGMRPEESMTVIPKVIGFPLKEAKSRLWEVGLNVGKIDRDEGIHALNEVDARVYVQQPGQSRTVELGTVVSLKLTLDPKKIEESSTASDKTAAQAAAAQRKAEQEKQEAKQTPEE